MIRYTKSARSWKRAAAAGIASAAVAFSVIGVSAQPGQPDPLTPPGLDQQIPGWSEGRGGMPGGRGPGGPGMHGMPGGRGPVASRIGGLRLVQFIASELGVAPSEIVTRLQAGDVSLSGVITELGGDATAVLEAAIAAASERVTLALTNGRIDQAQADALLTEIRDRLTQAFTSTPLEQRADQLGWRVVLDTAAARLNVTPRALQRDLRAGSTLSQLLTDGGIDAAAFTADVTARMQARLNVQVVDGVLTQAQADALLAAFQANLETWLNQTAGALQSDAAAGI
ncbi:MAG: hypothetical protein ACUVS2_18105 [Candidatus Flexifilum sp.]